MSEIKVKIIADSIGPAGIRLTTAEFTYHRLFHSELMTYRKHSRNAASSRAIPVSKTLRRVWKDPAIPVWWGKNESGMQAREELRGWRKWLAIKLWILSSKIDVIFAWMMLKLGLHKQIANRILEPAMWITTIVTSDEYGWANMFHQRNHADAQPEFAELARKFWVLYNTSKPQHLKLGEWHLPYITPQDVMEALPRSVGNWNDDYARALIKLKAVSVGRCARVSYLNHDGKRSMEADIKLHDKLKSANPGHWSPFEHVCQAMSLPAASGNVRGWKQYRKEFENEFLDKLPEWKPEN